MWGRPGPGSEDKLCQTARPPGNPGAAPSEAGYLPSRLNIAAMRSRFS